MRTPVLATVAVAATLALAACGAPSTPDFVQKAAMSDMYEVEAGKIASEKGKSDAIKQFGQQMIEAHTKTTEELKGIVAAEKIKVELPTKLDSKHQGLIDNLNKASADDFDKTYADQQAEAHQTAVDLFESYSKDGDNAAIKAFAAKTLPVIKEHLKMAKDLEAKSS
jgi:putative membrane protein